MKLPTDTSPLISTARCLEPKCTWGTDDDVWNKAQEHRRTTNHRVIATNMRNRRGSKIRRS